jgi:hypothetical protein
MTEILSRDRVRRVDPARAVAVWAVGYGGLRLVWTVRGGPDFEPLGSDLLGFTGWWAVALCAAAGLVATVIGRATTWRPALAGLGWAVVGCLVAAAGILLPEIVSLLLLNIGPWFDPLGLASRVVCVGGAALLALTIARYQRRTRGDCPQCCRTGTPSRGWTSPPVWAWVAAYAGVAGFVVRIGAQLVVGADGMIQDGSLIALEVGFALAGVLLPLALVHSWGRIWPRWVPGLAGRVVPRLVLLIPAFGLGAGLMAYFGMGMVQLLTSGSVSQFSDAFLWVAMSSYWVLGLGLVVAGTSYHLRTRTACAGCGR